MEEKRVILTKEQAIALLPDEEYIHTFISVPRNVLIGTDWKREEIIDAINSHTCEVGGPMCRAMGHGLAVMKKGDPLFVETKEGALKDD